MKMGYMLACLLLSISMGLVSCQSAPSEKKSKIIKSNTMTTIKLGNKCDSLRIVKTENTVTPIPRPIAMFEAIPQPEPERFTVEVIAHFPGGQERFKEFVKDQMVTPARCVEEEIDGMVAVQFDINERGRVDSIVFLSECKACPEYSQEILRVLKSSPMWYPAQKNGRIIRSTKTLKFKIHNED